MPHRKNYLPINFNLLDGGESRDSLGQRMDRKQAKE